MRDHRSLKAFRKADELALLVYRATTDFPDSERFGLTSQLRRGAVSVPSNIVEGAARSSDADFVRFLDISFGALKEMRYQWSLARRLHFVEEEQFHQVDEKLEEAVKTLAGFIRFKRKRLEP